MQGLFRQGKQEKALACPNARLIRTRSNGKGWLLSECKVYSDKASRKRPLHVRMRGLFGQGQTGKVGCCLNARFIQTRQAGRDHWMSECEAYSDRVKRER